MHKKMHLGRKEEGTYGREERRMTHSLPLPPSLTYVLPCVPPFLCPVVVFKACLMEQMVAYMCQGSFALQKGYLKTSYLNCVIVRVRHTDKLREDTSESKLSLAARERQIILSEELPCVTAFY
ncbi:hypothetical protein AMECASPLE_038950 [Ameca splendens]|uniref:Uncharacterized protein n=1 Tax=Ameca splendens TaxID=208324 RepID=A0ABV0XXK4_9TELE